MTNPCCEKCVYRVGKTQYPVATFCVNRRDCPCYTPKTCECREPHKISAYGDGVDLVSVGCGKCGLPIKDIPTAVERERGRNGGLTITDLEDARKIVDSVLNPAPWEERFDEFFKMYDLNSQTVKSFIAKEIEAARHLPD